MKSIVFFDGVCNLCNAWVDFLAPRLKDQAPLYFASLQGHTAAKYVKNSELDSVLLFHHDRLLRESDAVLALLGFLRMPWPLLKGFAILPRSLRNAIYRWVARNRYRWFGKREECRVPNAAERAWFRDRFLD